LAGTGTGTGPRSRQVLGPMGSRDYGQTQAEGAGQHYYQLGASTVDSLDGPIWDDARRSGKDKRRGSEGKCSPKVLAEAQNSRYRTSVRPITEVPETTPLS
jgi:hypothetical protein